MYHILEEVLYVYTCALSKIIMANLCSKIFISKESFKSRGDLAFF